jgi:hypothetical protein
MTELIDRMQVSLRNTDVEEANGKIPEIDKAVDDLVSTAAGHLRQSQV